MKLSGKTIIITGAKRIGQTVGKTLAQKGANLVVVYNSSNKEVEGLVKEVQDYGVRAISLQANLSSQDDIKTVVEKTLAEFGSIDGIVHMAAPYPKTPLGQITMDDVDKIMRAIAGSAIILGQEVGLKMREGKIIFFSDWSVLHAPYKDYLVYNAAKASIESITKTLALVLAPKVSVNAIAPGPILPPPDLTDEENEEALVRTPLSRWGGADEIAKAVLYLFESDFTTGVVLPVDGGRSIA